MRMYICSSKLILCVKLCETKTIKRTFVDASVQLKEPLLTHQFSNEGRSKHANSILYISVFPSPQLCINNTDTFFIVYFCPQRQTTLVLLTFLSTTRAMLFGNIYIKVVEVFVPAVAANLKLCLRNLENTIQYTNIYMYIIYMNIVTRGKKQPRRFTVRKKRVSTK